MAVRREDIATLIREMIMTEPYEAGDKLPSYRELRERFGGSRDTIGAAMQQLANEGLVALGDKRAAVVREPHDLVPTPQARLADARSELLALRADVVDVQARLSDVTKRVDDALGKLRK